MSLVRLFVDTVEGAHFSDSELLKPSKVVRKEFSLRSSSFCLLRKGGRTDAISKMTFDAYILRLVDHYHSP